MPADLSAITADLLAETAWLDELLAALPPAQWQLPTPAPGWTIADQVSHLAYFDEAYLAARMAQCFRDLGEAGHAARYARRSLDMDGRYVRGRAFNLSLLATAYATQGEPEQASVVGRQALDLTVRLTSARSVRYVRDLVRVLRPQADVAAVRDFTAEVRERLPAAAGRAAPRRW